jgi:hypothetical protein
MVRYWQTFGVAKMNVILPVLIIALLVVFSVDIKQKRRSFLNDHSAQNGH